MSWVTNRRRMAAVCSALALAGTVAACGDDEDDAAGGGGEATAAKAEFTGKPVTVFLQAPIKTQISDNADAETVARKQVEKINAAGGLNGSEVKLEVCNDTDANAELSCVRKAVKAEAIAFVGSSFVYNPKAGQAELEKAKIPSIAPLAIQQVEYGSKINFPIYTTSFGLLACPSQALEASGAKQVSSIAQDLPVQKELLGTIKAIAAATKVPYGKNVTTPVSQSDFSGPVKQLADSDADLVVDILAPTTQAPFFTAIRSVGEEFKAFCGAAANFTYDTLEQLGQQAENVYISNGMPAIDEASAEKLPLIKAFREEVDGVELRTQGNALNTFLGFRVLQDAAKSVNGELTGTKLLAAMNKLEVDLSGAGLPPIDFSKPVPAPGLERLFNPMVNLMKYDPGEKEFVATDVKPVNVLELFGALQKK